MHGCSFLHLSPLLLCLLCCSVLMLPFLCVCLSVHRVPLIDADQVLYTCTYLYWMLQWAKVTGWRISSFLWEDLSPFATYRHTHTMKETAKSPPAASESPLLVVSPFRAVCNWKISFFSWTWKASFHSELGYIDSLLPYHPAEAALAAHVCIDIICL